MTEPSTESLRDVSDTALWVAAYRAEESERPDALFRDPFARRLAGQRGFDVLTAMPKGRSLAWPMVVRTLVFDRFIRDRLGEGIDLVLNLAAGLDARPYRMELPSELTWVEVDLPHMIEYKSEILAGEQPACKLERIALDLADPKERRALLEDVSGRCRRALVVTEGLLIYLDRQSVESLADELAAAGSFQWWITDLASPGLLKTMGRTWGKAVEGAGAPFRFAPPEGPAFFVEHGWSATEIESSFHVAARLKRLPAFLRLLAALFPEPRKFNPKRIWSGLCLFERALRSS